ncbi:MAG: ZIP family metal transporter [Candidatus Marinimicrobia bacterium]|nr:ZIP family metal transporter [Candidatus Neomarinimicrobiota bacterium]
MTVLTYTILSVLLVSLVSLVGLVTLSISRKLLDRIMTYLVSFATGSLFGGALIHLLPEAFASASNPLHVSLWTIGGLATFFVMEKFFRWRHCHHPTTNEHVHPIVPMNIFGDAMHNFIDGVLIAISYSASIPLGVATTVAVLFHEIPQEISDYSILINGGLSVKKALMVNLMSASLAMVGALFALQMGKSITGFTDALVPITAGGFLYIAGSDLIPELHHNTDAKKSFIQLLMLVAGVAVMTFLAVKF